MKYFIPFVRLMLLSLFLCLLSCTKSETAINKIFKHSISIQYKKIIDDKDYLIGSTGKMLIVDSILIAIDQANKYILHIFDIKNNKYIHNLGSKGQGPNEFLHLSSLVNSTSHHFLAYDLLDNSLKKINIDSLLAGNVFYDKLITFNSISNLSVFPTEYDNYIAFGLYDSNMFKLIGKDGGDLGYFLDFPVEKSKMNGIDNKNAALAYQGILSINPDKNKMVYASLYSTILGIYDINQASIAQNFLLLYDYPQYTIQNEEKGMSSPITKDGISAFRDVYVTDKYIYSLYSGKKISALKEKAFEAQDIYVFDWDGNPIVHYNLDVAINTIAVIPDNKKIYAISNLPEPTLIEFEINL